MAGHLQNSKHYTTYRPSSLFLDSTPTSFAQLFGFPLLGTPRLPCLVYPPPHEKNSMQYSAYHQWKGHNVVGKGKKTRLVRRPARDLAMGDEPHHSCNDTLKGTTQNRLALLHSTLKLIKPALTGQTDRHVFSRPAATMWALAGTSLWTSEIEPFL